MDFLRLCPTLLAVLILTTNCLAPNSIERVSPDFEVFNETLIGVCHHVDNLDPLNRQCSEWRGKSYTGEELASECNVDWDGEFDDNPCDQSSLIGTCILHSRDFTQLHFYYSQDWNGAEAEDHCVARGYEARNMPFTVYWASGSPPQ